MNKELKKEIISHILKATQSVALEKDLEKIIAEDIDKTVLAEREKIKELITKEIALAHIEGEATSRLTSLANKLDQDD